MKKLLGLAALAMVAIAATIVPAAAETTVTIPTGDWLSQLAQFATPAAALISTLVFGLIGKSWLGQYVTASMRDSLEQLLEKAIQWSINDLKLRFPQVDVPMSNDVIAGALNYAIQHAPGIVQWAGGTAMVQQKIVARLNISPAAINGN